MSPIEYGLEDLKKTFGLRSFAKLIGVQPRTLAFILYKLPDSRKYLPKKIPKKNGDFRQVYVPHDLLKTFQKKTAQLLVNCERDIADTLGICLLYTSPSPRDATLSRMPSSA